MGEAIHAIVWAHRCKELQTRHKNNTVPYAPPENPELLAKYAFFLAANALENCAHAILQNSQRLSPALLEDIDKLSTLNKFEIFAAIHEKTIDRGDDRYAKVKEVVKCRNAFVHPKMLMVPMEWNTDRAIPKLVGAREYPLAFDFVEVEHVTLMIGDILRFISWVVFDICKYRLSDASRLISDNSEWWVSDFVHAESEWKYDFRSFGKVQVKRKYGCVTPSSQDGDAKPPNARRGWR